MQSYKDSDWYLINANYFWNAVSILSPILSKILTIDILYPKVYRPHTHWYSHLIPTGGGTGCLVSFTCRSGQSFTIYLVAALYAISFYVTLYSYKETLKQLHCLTFELFEVLTWNPYFMYHRLFCIITRLYAYLQLCWIYEWLSARLWYLHW